MTNLYPAGWPRCPVCGEPALDGHITCGAAACNESRERRRKADAAGGRAPRFLAIPAAAFEELGPEQIADRLKAAGFVFEQEGCPWRLREPYRIARDLDDSVITIEQWDRVLQ